MCGLVGFWQFDGGGLENLSAIASKMADQIVHRGPDSRGVWQDNYQPFVLAHQRLAIRDLSAHGAQPMHSECGRWVIAYNGEIYNCEELQQLLPDNKNYQNDTAVLLKALSVWGIDKTLTKINGMFAFALWDKQEKKLTLVRDRLGIKPLYWGFNQGTLFFGSQLKAFKAHPRWRAGIDQRALASYFRMNYINAPQTIYENIQKIKPGYYLQIDAKAKTKEVQYWDILNTHPITTDYTHAKNTLHTLLKDSVKRRMIADVPLGAFLSGGIDSSLIVSLMQNQSSQKIKTFSIGFNEEDFNEAIYAKKVAEHLGTEHHELYCTTSDAISLIPKLTEWYDEPFADSSQLPTYLVSQLTKTHVTVALSGDGGDELFAGYNRYFTAYSLFKKFSILPRSLRHLLANGIGLMSPATWDQLAKVIPHQFRPKQLGDKAHKFSGILKNTTNEFYLSLISLWQDPSSLLQTPTSEYPLPNVTRGAFIQQMQLLDAMTYLPEDILTKVDRASMAVSLEARVPLLDYRIAEFAFSLPQSALIQKGKGKWILRDILQEYVPYKLINRPKMGFGVPIGQWLRSSLREWAEELLRQPRLEDSGLNSLIIREKWHQHLTGARNWQYPLWGVLMYQMWHEHNF